MRNMTPNLDTPEYIQFNPVVTSPTIVLILNSMIHPEDGSYMATNCQGVFNVVDICQVVPYDTKYYSVFFL